MPDRNIPDNNDIAAVNEAMLAKKKPAPQQQPQPPQLQSQSQQPQLQQPQLQGTVRGIPVRFNQTQNAQARPVNAQQSGQARPATAQQSGQARPTTANQNGQPRTMSTQPNTQARPTSAQPNGQPRPTTTQPNGQPRPTTAQQNGQARPASAQPNGQPRPVTTQPNGQARPASAQPNAQARPASAQPNAQARPASAQPNGQPRQNGVVPVSARPRPVQSGIVPTGTQPPVQQNRTTPNGASAQNGAALNNASQNSVVPLAQNAVQARQPAPDDTPTRTLDKAAFTKTTQGTGFTQSAAAVKAAAKTKKRRRDNTLVSVIFAVVYIVFIVVAAIFLAAFVINVADDMFALTKVNEDMVEITLPEDATVNEVADILYENGVIKYPTVFKIRANMKLKSDDYFVAGTHTVSGSQNYDQLRRSLLYRETVEIYRITIPEGYTTDEIIDLFVSYGIGTREGFVAELARVFEDDTDDKTGETLKNDDGTVKHRYDYWFVDELRENPPSADRFYVLDGYLFPDTYDFYSNATERTVITKLLDNFEYRFQDAWKLRAEDLGYTVDEVLIIASLIEKEAKYLSDFSYVSSVFHNRLNHSASYPCMESDATIMYAIQHDSGSRLDKLTGADTSYDSKYNTYIYRGLTPGPIANPGYNAINYALYPANTNYYYFVSNNAGATYFAENSDGQLENINRVREENAAAAAN